MRQIRRKDRAVSQEDCMRILEKGIFGVLSTVGPEGQPYPTPLSYVYLNGAVYFHCALEGRKIDNMRHEAQVGFVVVDNVAACYVKDFSTYYESVIVFGQAAEVTDDGEKCAALKALCEKYLPEHMDKFAESIERSLKRTAVYMIRPEVMTGKAKR